MSTYAWKNPAGEGPAFFTENAKSVQAPTGKEVVFAVISDMTRSGKEGVGVGVMVGVGEGVGAGVAVGVGVGVVLGVGEGVGVGAGVNCTWA